MNEPRKSQDSPRTCAAVGLLAATFFFACSGPNLPHDKAPPGAPLAQAASSNAHAGNWSARANLAREPSWTKLNRYDTFVSKRTAYTASVWVKGTGRLRFDVVNSDWRNNLASVTIDAPSTWQRFSVPTFNTGENTAVHFSVYDAVGGRAGTVYLDDAFLGTVGGTNLLSNPGFESGADTWIPEGVFSVVRSGGSGCRNAASVGKLGCADLLDASARELGFMKRKALDPSLAGAQRPSGAYIKELATTAAREVAQVIDSIPSDAELKPNDDVRPYIAALGRALSTTMLVQLPPLGAQPDGRRSTDVLDGSSANPDKPLLSELFEHLAYEGDPQSNTLALYRLADFQNLVQSLNRTELVYLDEGMTEAVVALVKRLLAQRKSVVALGFYDHVLPAALLVYDVAKRRYTPRILKVLKLDPRRLGALPSLDASATETVQVRLAKNPTLGRMAFDGTWAEYLYCKQPPALHLLSKFGIWLSDRTQGGRLNRVRLGAVSPCDFLRRVTDLTRLGAGDCSLTEIAYSGYQCASPRTCALAPSDRYKLGVRPGASVSALNQFGVPKTLAKAVSCEPSQALPGTPGGYLTTLPGSECIVSADDIALLQHAFLTCIADSQGGPIRVIEPPTNPWNDKCKVIDCEEGANCPTEPAPDEDMEDAESSSSSTDEPESSNCADNDDVCKVEEYADRHQGELDQAIDDWSRDTCAGCLQGGWQQGMRDALGNMPPVEVRVNQDLPPGVSARTKWKDEQHSGIEILRDDAEIEQAAFAAVANRNGMTVEMCRADDICLMQAIKQAATDLVLAEQHEYVHAILNTLIDSGGVFTDAGLRYFGMFNQGWENIFSETSARCHQGVGTTCSAQHEIEYRFFRILHPNGKGFLDCGVEGACGSGCGPDNPSYERSQACSELARRLQEQYDQRLHPRCPPPRPNEGPIRPECTFPGCFSDGTDVTARACPFVLCTGEQSVGSDLACSCCRQCNQGPVPGSGVSPECSGRISCGACCARCQVGSTSAPCPEPFGPVAVEQPAGWRVQITSPVTNPITTPAPVTPTRPIAVNPDRPIGPTVPVAPSPKPTPTPTLDPDPDRDRILDPSDNCPTTANPNQHDLDGDGVGYACDPNDEVVGRGTLTNWDEADTLQFDALAGAHGSDIPAWWSARDTASAFVYARASGLEVAATGRTSFSQITNANAFSFTTDSVQIPVGAVAVLRNRTVGTYAALRLTSAAWDGNAWRANMTWVFSGHSANIASVR